ncbi:hypothetical protein ACED47_10610 [Vibrio splendidus]|uniref:hypothetical protein n=1 Tax=Vibrio splendidus TaxID=29497 RepID=UPI00352F37EE
MTRKVNASEFFLASMLVFFISILNLGVLPLGLFLIFSGILLAYGRFLSSVSSYIFLFFFFLFLSYGYIFKVVNPLDVGYTATYIYCFLCFVGFSIFNDYSTVDKIKILRFVIQIHCFALFSQSLVYLLTSKYIDLHYIITFFTYESRYESSSLSFLNVARSTGFSIEPSNAAAVITYLNLVYLIFKGKVDRFFIISQLFTLLTLSFASIAVSVGIVISSLLYFSHREGRVRLFLGAVLLSFTLGFLAIFIITWRLEDAVDYDAIGYRMVIFSYFNNANIYELIFGQGIHIFNTPTFFNNVLLNSSNIRDPGLLVNILFSFGFLGVMAIFLLLYFLSSNVLVFFVVIFCLILKFDYMQPIFWFAIFSMISYKVSSLVRFR